MALQPVVLEGRLVRMEPLTMAHHEQLAEVGLDEDLWRWTWGMIRTADDLRAYMDTALLEQAEGRSLPFATIWRQNGRAIGSTRYGNIALEHRRLEIGWTWLGKAWQRTGANTEAKLLLLTHAFEVLGMRRVEFKTDALNTEARRALLRIGAKEEGTFRKHGTAAGARVRDSVYYSIVDDEWPEVKAGLEALRTR